MFVWFTLISGVRHFMKLSAKPPLISGVRHFMKLSAKPPLIERKCIRKGIFYIEKDFMNLRLVAPKS
jgi:hypothetical protein